MFNVSWVEKFRPKKLNEIISQEEIVSSLKDVIKKKNIPHLLFFGPSGCGKTSTILALARELFGDKFWEGRVIELNASDERGIKVVRDKIKKYAKNAVKLNDNIPPWKIIILDEADNMTSDSQFALRKIMEDYSKVTRFCIICNYHHKIIETIVSRCSMFRFRPIPIKEIKNKLLSICQQENIHCSKKNIGKIIKISRGDLRKAVNLLQKCKRNKNFISTDKKVKSIDSINEELIDEISGIIPIDKLRNFILYCINVDIEKVETAINNFNNDAYSLTNQIDTIANLIIKDTEISNKLSNNTISLIIQKLVEIDQHLIKGCDEYIQFYRLGYYIMSLM